MIHDSAQSNQQMYFSDLASYVSSCQKYLKKTQFPDSLSVFHTDLRNEALKHVVGERALKQVQRSIHERDQLLHRLVLDVRAGTLAAAAGLLRVFLWNGGATKEKHEEIEINQHLSICKSGTEQECEKVKCKAKANRKKGSSNRTAIRIRNREGNPFSSALDAESACAQSVW
jgi:hypothetical protein